MAKFNYCLLINSTKRQLIPIYTKYNKIPNIINNPTTIYWNKPSTPLVSIFLSLSFSCPQDNLVFVFQAAKYVTRKHLDKLLTEGKAVRDENKNWSIKPVSKL